MSELIKELIKQLQEFNRLGNLAPEKLSALGEKDKKHDNLESYQAFWDKVVKESEEHTKAIESLEANFPENKLKMSQQLAFYRSLPLYIAECSPTWSAYCQDIRQRMKKIHCLLIDIDTKYYLGQHADD